MLTSKTRRNIVNPEKWIGKYVRHMANWRQFEWDVEGYAVCEGTGRLMRRENDAHWSDYFETLEQAEAAGYDECYYYCDAALMDMYQCANKRLVA